MFGVCPKVLYELFLRFSTCIANVGQQKMLRDLRNASVSEGFC